MRAYMNILRKSRGVQALAALLAAFVLADAAFYALEDAPAKDQVATLQFESQQADRSLKEKESELLVYQSFDSGRAGVDKFKALLPHRGDYTRILKNLHRMAREDGMKAENIGTERKSVEQEGGLDQLSFSMPVTGSYQDARKYIYDIETSPLFLNIDNLGLSGADKSDEISLTIGLSTYVRS